MLGDDCPWWVYKICLIEEGFQSGRRHSTVGVVLLALGVLLLVVWCVQTWRNR
jgi:hypothetical protein